MASHSSILAWRIPWTEEPGGLQSMRSQRVRHDERLTHILANISWAFSLFQAGLGTISSSWPLWGRYCAISISLMRKLRLWLVKHLPQRLSFTQPMVRSTFLIALLKVWSHRVVIWTLHHILKSQPSLPHARLHVKGTEKRWESRRPILATVSPASLGVRGAGAAPLRVRPQDPRRGAVSL